GEREDVNLAGARFFESPLEMIEAVWIAHRHNHVAGPDLDHFRRYIFGRFEPELLHLPLMRAGALTVVSFGKHEGDKKAGCKRQARYRGDLLRKHVDSGQREQGEGDQSQTGRDLRLADVKIERHLPLGRSWLLEAQHEH